MSEYVGEDPYEYGAEKFMQDLTDLVGQPICLTRVNCNSSDSIHYTVSWHRHCVTIEITAQQMVNSGLSLRELCFDCIRTAVSKYLKELQNV